MSRADLACKELVELLNDYLEGTLDVPTRTRLESHLTSCDGCANALAQLRKTIETTGRLTEEQVPGRQRGELLAMFRRFRSDEGH